VRRGIRTVLALVLIASLTMLALAGCGGTTGNTTGDVTPPAVKLKAGMVTDIGGLGDKSFNDLS
jgi:basic membrane lipoprotein Med (substrate-binding protein (PBP1-ABC) superfamily)